jgi:hypothetical protein
MIRSKLFFLLFAILMSISACNLTAPPVTPEIENPTAIPDTGTTATEPVVFYVVSLEQRLEAIKVGCDTFIVPRSTAINRTSDEAANIRAALEELLTMATGDLQQEGQINDLADQQLTVGNVEILGDVAVVDLRGTLILAGVCSDALITTQLLYTIFENSSVNNARVMVEGRNLKEIMSASGLPVPEDSVYTRAEFIQP